eukprot:5644176-Prymnesium_polylepis.1
MSLSASLKPQTAACSQPPSQAACPNLHHPFERLGAGSARSRCAMDSDLAKESASPSEASVAVHVEGVHPDGTADADDGAPNVRASAGSGVLGSDKRDRRIAHAHIYTEGVVAWRAAQPLVVNDQAQAQADAVSPHARVYVRVRPLFEHESERGEWSAVSVVGGITLHEGIER